MKSILSRVILIGLLLISTVGCDQVTKVVVREKIPMNQSLPYLGGLFILEHAENPGAFLSLGADMTKAWRFWIFSGVVGGGLLYACYYIIRRKNLGLVPTIASALVIAGGFGNLIDRLARGTVTDFMNFGFGSLRTGIFNVADIAITVGALLLVALSFRDSSKQEKENAA